MNTQTKYYVIAGLASANPNKNLSSDIRVVAIPSDFPFQPSNLIGYDSLINLRRHDLQWKKLKLTSNKLADKICDEKFVLDFKDFIMTPVDSTFNKYSFDLLKHTIEGKFNKDFGGLHLLCDFNKDIIKIEQTKPADKNGVWEADIHLLKKVRNEVLVKRSTLFPKHWTPSHFMFEIFSAIQTINITETLSKYSATTKSGVPVKIIIKEGRAKTVYPEYTDNSASS